MFVFVYSDDITEHSTWLSLLSDLDAFSLLTILHTSTNSYTVHCYFKITFYTLAYWIKSLPEEPFIAIKRYSFIDYEKYINKNRRNESIVDIRSIGIAFKK